MIRARNTMGGKQQRALDILPLLFHINHSQLPGFIDNQVPCGVYQFTANEMAVKHAREVADFILQQRNQRKRYPCYLTDIDLTDFSASGTWLQTIVYLQHKQKIERSLNRALQESD